uniref:HP domain-containing protein n=1 Tax=Oncorhynchus tshawytscha TaxID=74940 RepID=A0AAZ3PTQ5_ONCTS
MLRWDFCDSFLWCSNMKMVPVPDQAFGNFFEGDCYIVLYRSQGSSNSMDVHYWIGNSSSQDEQGAAAILVTQLDEFLGGSPVQHREVQAAESSKFRSYFRNGLIYKKGGVDSGFRHVESNVYKILRLLHIKGRKHVTATEVEVSWSSFNSGDVFLLDMGKVIVQWNGPQSNRSEKLKAMLLAQDVRDRERGGRAQIGVVEGGDEEDSPELMKIMRAVLGQRSGKLKEAEPDDTPDRHQQTANIRLYNVSDESGKLVVQEVAMQPLTQDLLHSTECYIVDQGGSSVLVWKGKEASIEERRSALGRAVGFIKAKNYSSSTNVEVMAEGGESAMFKHLFISWTEKGQTKGLGNVYTTGKIAKVEQVKFDVMELYARPELAAQQRMVDDASGQVQIWRIEDLELRELHPSSFGQFYGGDCYLVLYTYKRASKLQYILYMWQGRHATQDEITSCAYQAVAMDNKYSGVPVQVRVVMGKEPRHFLAIFKGKLIIFESGVTNPGPGARLFQVRGTHEMNTRATEVPARSSSLNTNDVFLLKTDHTIYLWYGKGCSGDEREMAKAVADVLSRQDKQVVMEGQEPAEFWVALGGKAPYACDKRLQKEETPHSPRLFECSNQTGRFRMTEVEDLTQEDLDQDDVMLLDTWEEIFLWIGRSANEYETKEACNSALEYLRTHPAGRDPDTPIISVKQGYEPLTFTGWFNAWDPQKWSNLNNTELSKGSAGGSSGGAGYSAPGGPAQFSSPPSYKLHLGTGGGSCGPSSPATPGAPRTGEYLGPELLINKSPNELPKGVDPNRREDYLSDVDLENLLGCSRSGFQRLPRWRQNDLKKKAGLF